MDLDLVLQNGVVYDGSGGPAMALDVGIRGDRIAALAPGLKGQESVDCRGLCIAPGFIDAHAHSDLMGLAQPGLEQKVRQGVTLEVLGNDGVGVAPLRTGDLAARRERLAALLGAPEVDWSWRSVASFLAALDQARLAVDTAYLVPHGALRECLVGLDTRKAQAHDIFKMKGLLARCLDEGGLGLSVGPAGSAAAELAELVELAAVAAGRQMLLAASLRDDGDGLLESLRELLHVARQSTVHLHLSHLAIAGDRNHARIDELLELLDAGRAGGVKVTADVCPYAAGTAPLARLLPPGAREGGHAAMRARLADPDQRKSIREEIERPGTAGWQNLWAIAGPEKLVLAELPADESQAKPGMSLASAAAAAGRHALDFALDLIARAPGASLVRFDQDEQVLERLLKHPGIAVCSDAVPGHRAHPKASGSFPRLFARFVRERGALSLAAAIRRVTGLTADIFGLADHGYVIQGKRANLVVFDPDRIAERASFEQPDLPPEGIRDVFVGGQPVLRNGELTGERPGRVARRH